MVPELLIPVLDSQPAGDVSHKPGGRLPLLSARPVEGCYQFRCLVNRGMMDVNSMPKTVTRQRRDCDLNPDLLVPESSTQRVFVQRTIVSSHNALRFPGPE